MRIDLHTHSTASDGTDTPEQVVAVAARAGVDVLALTDHDTTQGWAPALAALPDHMTLVRGTEFSTKWFREDDSRISVHLLGYLFDPEDAALGSERDRVRDSRINRGREIVGRMVEGGLPITWERVETLAAGGSIGRPHIARALVEAGVVPDVSSAFTDLLSTESPYYVQEADMDVVEAVRLVRGAGGLPVLAHGQARRRGDIIGDDAIRTLAAAGLVGLEIDHPDHTEEDRAHLRELAAELDLVGLGSSDYHGTNKPTPIAACTTSDDAYQRLVDRPTAIRPVRGDEV
ncbi:PHP domain-containing protein [Jatrophihabitans sp. YIM 134969]